MAKIQTTTYWALLYLGRSRLESSCTTDPWQRSWAVDVQVDEPQKYKEICSEKGMGELWVETSQGNRLEIRKQIVVLGIKTTLSFWRKTLKDLSIAQTLPWEMGLLSWPKGQERPVEAFGRHCSSQVIPKYWQKMVSYCSQAERSNWKRNKKPIHFIAG